MSKARQALPTVTFLHVGMLSEIKRKTRPSLAKVAGDLDPQALHHFVAKAPWSSELEMQLLQFVVAIRSNHGVWLPPGQRVRYTRLSSV